MYRLNIRRHWYLALVFSSITLVCMAKLPSQFPDQVIPLPILGFLALTVGEILLCVVLSIGCYPSATPQQLTTIACTLMGSSMLFGAIGNVACSATHLIPGTSPLLTGLVVSWIQLVIMNIGGLASTLTLYQLVNVQGQGKEAEAAATHAGIDFSDRIRSPHADTSKVVSADASTMLAPHGNFFAGQSVGDSAVQPVEAPGGGSASASNLARQGEEAHTTSNPPAAHTSGANVSTVDKPENQKKKGSITSGFNKPSALSATKSNIPLAPLPVETGGLSSLLDRLDAEPTGDKSPAAEKSSRPKASAPTVTTNTPSITGGNRGAKPETAASAGGSTVARGMAVVNRLLDAATSQNRLPSIDPRNLLTTSSSDKTAKVQSEADKTATNLPQNSTRVEAGISIPEIPKPAFEHSGESENPAASSKPITPQDETAIKLSPGIVEEQVNLSATAPPTASSESAVESENQVASAKELAAGSSKNSNGLTGIGASLGKPALNKPSRPGLISKFVGLGSGTDISKVQAREAITAKSEGLAEAQLVVAETTIVETTATPETSDINSSRDRIFSQGIDADVDNIFSNLAPAGAQKDFDPTFLTNREEPTPDEAPQAVASASAEVVVETEPVNNLFGKRVDESIDDIFSALTPEAAQRDYSPALLDIDELPLAEPAFTEPSLTLQAPQAVAENSIRLEAEPVGNIFGQKVDDNIDDLFSTLAPGESQREVAASDYAQTSIRSEANQSAQPEAVSAPKPAGFEKVGLFDNNVNNEIDDIFAQLAPAEEHRTVDARKQDVETTEQSFAPVGEIQAVAKDERSEMAEAPTETINDELVVAQVDFSPEPLLEEDSEEEDPAYDAELSEVTVINPVTKNLEVKEFGRLSDRAITPSDQAPVGTMKTIGKLLLDVAAIENIIKSGESGTIGSGLANARIITEHRGEGILALLHQIDTHEGVSGSLIVGHDGLVIASTVKEGIDKDTLGALATALLSTTNLATLKLDIGKLQQMVLLTKQQNIAEGQQYATVLTDVQVGILAVFLDTQQLDKVDALLKGINATIRG